MNSECSVKIENIQIISITGSIIRNITYNPDKIEISDLMDGLYIIKIQTNEGVYSDTFIKQ